MASRRPSGPAVGTHEPVQAPPRPMIDPAEITSVITKLTVEVDRKESEVIRLASGLEVANRRIATLEGLLDTFLQKGWREGNFAFQDDLLQAPDAPPPAEPASMRVSKPE